MDQVRMGRFFGSLIIHPFLFLIDIIDCFMDLILPYNNQNKNNIYPKKNVVLSVQLDKSDPYSPWRSTLSNDLFHIDNENANIYDEFLNNYKKFAQYGVKTLGIREVLSVNDELQPNGKIFKKFSLSNDYKWSTYQDVLDRINNISNGLLKIGLNSDQNVVLFAETRPEWLVSAFACFRIKSPIVTLYSTLGIEALAHGINETKSNYVITSSEQLPKINKILDKIPSLKNLIVFTDKFTEQNLIEFKITSKSYQNLSVYSLSEIENLGYNSSKIDNFKKPTKNDLAVIMYTSGSTGTPKGVMISHGNILTSSRSLISRLGHVDLGKDKMIAYLPLAHVLELVCEIVCLVNGISIGYSTPQTITDISSGIKQGQKGDLRVLSPTMMAAVPIILERLSKAVKDKLSNADWFKQTLFKQAYEQKLRKFKLGVSTRLLDRILFKPISSAILGGEIKVILSGGALLSKEVHEFTQVCLCPAVQAYGLTETSACATTQMPNQTENETVGSVATCSEIRLVDWSEAGYRVTDKPNPRGEILIGGDNIAMGYFNLVSDDFKFINGIKYFATGDIGEMLPNGNLKIIDRKKDLVKLSGGEYVSLNKIESIIKLLPLVDNICVIADSKKSYCVGLVCPNLKQLKELIKKEIPEIEVEDEPNPDKLLANLCFQLEINKKLVDKLSKEIMNHCVGHGIDRFEIPTKVKFVKEIWLPDTGLVTDSLKLKRKEIEKFYAKEIDLLYN